MEVTIECVDEDGMSVMGFNLEDEEYKMLSHLAGKRHATMSETLHDILVGGIKREYGKLKGEADEW